MENSTIYSHQLDWNKIVEITKNGLQKANIEVNDNGIQKSLVATIKGGFFGKAKTLTINYRERENPSHTLDKIECGLTQNLAGMTNFIQSLPAKNEQVRTKFLFKVKSANCEMAFIGEPKITKEFEGVLKNIINSLDAFIFTPPNSIFTKSTVQHFVDKNFNLILDTNGNCGIQDIDVSVNSKYADQPSETLDEEQLNRKAQSEKFLEEKGVHINKYLPCVESTNNFHLRSKPEIIDRAYALLITAVKGEGIEQANLVKAVEAKQIISFSPKEKYIYEADSLNDQEKTYATWRYESLYTILWALGIVDELKYPSEICDVQEIVGKIFHPSREEFEDTVTLKSKSEIADELDKTYRMHWACVNARLKGESPTGDINPSVVYERHYSLNWLTRYEDEDWDNVSTHT